MPLPKTNKRADEKARERYENRKASGSSGGSIGRRLNRTRAEKDAEWWKAQQNANKLLGTTTFSEWVSAADFLAVERGADMAAAAMDDFGNAFGYLVPNAFAESLPGVQLNSDGSIMGGPVVSGDPPSIMGWPASPAAPKQSAIQILIQSLDGTGWQQIDAARAWALIQAQSDRLCQLTMSGGGIWVGSLASPTARNIIAQEEINRTPAAPGRYSAWSVNAGGPGSSISYSVQNPDGSWRILDPEEFRELRVANTRPSEPLWTFTGTITPARPQDERLRGRTMSEPWIGQKMPPAVIKLSRVVSGEEARAIKKNFQKAWAAGEPIVLGPGIEIEYPAERMTRHKERPPLARQRSGFTFRIDRQRTKECPRVYDVATGELFKFVLAEYEGRVRFAAEGQRLSFLSYIADECGNMVTFQGGPPIERVSGVVGEAHADAKDVEEPTRKIRL